jgi:light-regulated signal transduction histidine kinase (bacteriophytochrome)
MNSQGQGVAPKAVPQDREWFRDFISMAAHDLREPLRAIRLGSRLVLADGRAEADENIAQGARYLSDGADRLETLIQDIAAYCYEEAREIESRETDLELALLDAKSELAQEVKTAHATITHDPLPTVMGSPASLAIVFRSLIANACKFRGDAAPQIHIGAAHQASDWIFSLKDNGLGFDPAYAERIFRPFERLNGKQYPGSGLGLTLARKIIERHGGRMWAESEPGGGSTFLFTLPFLS